MTPTSRFLGSALVLAVALSVSGCVCQVMQRGDVTFTWTFQGQQCAVVTAVRRVRITIPGQTLMNAGVYDCVTQGTAGITLLNFRGGSYRYTVQGEDAQGTVLYSASGQLVVDGDVVVPVDLQVNPSAPTSVFLTWTFPANGATGGQPASCAQAGATDLMYVAIDGQQVSPPPTCAAGQTSPGWEVRVTPGQHTIDIAAGAQTGNMVSGVPNVFYLYRKQSSLTAVAGAGALNQYALDWNAGSLNVTWTFLGAQGPSCAAAGVTAVDVFLLGEDNQYADLLVINPAYTKLAADAQGRIGYRFNCLMGGAMGASFPYVNRGTYRVYASASGSAGVFTNFAAPPMTTVTVGQFSPQPVALSLSR